MISDHEENVDGYNSAFDEEQNEAYLRSIYENDERMNDNELSENSDDEEGGLPKPDQRFFITRRVVFVTRSDVEAMLEYDNFCRKRQYWPLVSLEEMIVGSSKYDFGVVRDQFLFNPDRKVSPLRDFMPEMNNELTFIEDLEQGFSNVEMILKLGRGHLVIAGGAIAGLFGGTSGGGRTKDADFFFFDKIVGEETENGQYKSDQNGTENGGCKTFTPDDGEEIILEIIKWFMETLNDEQEGISISVTRNGHVTTIFDDNSEEMYQIIHRIYPNKSAVIGGFDLAPCSILYDGQHIYGTELSAFTFMSGYFFPDVSRQSFSFDARICKYQAKGFNPVFLTKSEQVIMRQFPIASDRSYRIIRIGGTLRFFFSRYDRETSSRLCKSKYSGFQPGSADYDNGQEYNPYAIENANSLMAARGKIEMIVWGGNKLKDIYGKTAVIPRVPEPTNIGYWRDVFSLLSITGKREALFRWFGKEFTDSKCPNEELDDFPLSRLDSLKKRIADGLAQAELTKGKLKWLGVNDNPSRQRFTSSIHPIDETVAWYNPEVRKTACIGIPFKTCCTLFHGWKEDGTVLHMLPKDIFNYIMKMIRVSMVYSPVAKWLSN